MAERQKHLNTLGLTASASEADIKKAYKQMALKYHPDKNDSHDAKSKFQEISLAYKYLTEGPESVAGYDPHEDIMEHLFTRLFPEMFFSPFGPRVPPFMFAHRHPSHFSVYESDDDDCYYYDDDDDDDYYYMPGRAQGRDTNRNNATKPSYTTPPPAAASQNISAKSARKREKRLRQKAKRKEHREEQQQQQHQRPQQKQQKSQTMYSDDIRSDSPPPKDDSKSTETKVNNDQPAPANTAPKKAPPPQPPKLTKEQLREQQLAEQRRREEEMKAIREELLAKQEQEREKQREKERKKAEKEKQIQEEKAKEEPEEFLSWYDNGKMSKKARKRERKRQEAAKAAEVRHDGEAEDEEVDSAASRSNTPREGSQQPRSSPKPHNNIPVMDYPEVKPLPDGNSNSSANRNRSNNSSNVIGPDQLSHSVGQGLFETGFADDRDTSGYSGGYSKQRGSYSESSEWNGNFNSNHYSAWDGHFNPQFRGRGGRGRGGYDHRQGFPDHGGFPGCHGNAQGPPFGYPPRGRGLFRPPPPPPHRFGYGRPPPEQFGLKNRGHHHPRNGYQSFPPRPPFYSVPPQHADVMFDSGHSDTSHRDPKSFGQSQRHKHKNQTTHSEHKTGNQTKTESKSKKPNSGRTFYNTTNNVYNGFHIQENNSNNSAQTDDCNVGNGNRTRRRNFYDEISTHSGAGAQADDIDSLSDMFSSMNQHSGGDSDLSWSQTFINKDHASAADFPVGASSAMDSLDDFDMQQRRASGDNDMHSSSKMAKGKHTASFIGGCDVKMSANKMFPHVGDNASGSSSSLDLLDDFDIPRNGGNAYAGGNLKNDVDNESSVSRHTGNRYSNTNRYSGVSDYDEEEEEEDDFDGDDRMSGCSLDSLGDYSVPDNSNSCSNMSSDANMTGSGTSVPFADLYSSYEGMLTSQHLNVPDGMRSASIANYYK